ncbi:DoxX family protein [Marinoscillum pacificum]|uniref:DoxX family protein n=1 Tax=Marinoscillum pacificum TaxID=392723 RepID=UPI0021586F00|nr:DoxX family protein [Marinoscillum pacificum]
MKIIFEWLLSILAAFLLLQTLFFKFSGSDESVYIFTQVGMEPWGRWTSGFIELIAGVLLLWPKYRVYGAIVALGVISGAIFFHLTSLGIEVMHDDGQLFYYALTVFISSLMILWMRKDDLPFLNKQTA